MIFSPEEFNQVITSSYAGLAWADAFITFTLVSFILIGLGAIVWVLRDGGG